MQQRWLFMGNPGSGKSTLLNCLLQRAAFDAGLSFGSGRTQKAQSEPWNDGIILVDTPGIADVDMRQEACDEITEELKRGGACKLFFVVTLRNGRASPQDVATYNEVLRSIDVKSIPFSLVVNNVRKQQHEQLMISPEAYSSTIAGLCGGEFSTDLIALIPEIAALDEEDNAIAKLPNRVLQFLDDALSCEIPPSAVRKINTDKDNFLAKSAELSNHLRALQHQKEVLKRQLASLEQSSREDPRAVMVSRSVTPNRSSGPAGYGSMYASTAQTQAGSLHLSGPSSSRMMPQPMGGSSTLPLCKHGHAWTKFDTMTKGLHCSVCGVPKPVSSTDSAGAGVGTNIPSGMAGPSGTPNRPSGSGAAQNQPGSLYQPSQLDSRTAPQPLAGYAALPQCKRGCSLAPDEMAAQFCPKCGARREAPPMAPAGANHLHVAADAEIVQRV